jgi:hypothetical protein
MQHGDNRLSLHLADDAHDGVSDRDLDRNNGGRSSR